MTSTDPVVVLDTNVVLDLLHYDDTVARPLLWALETERMRCVATDATLDEWRRVLAYSTFDLNAAEQARLFARYVALVSLVEPVGVPPELPRCSDPDDQKFLTLAASAQAHVLVSKDRALLKLRRRCIPRFQILTPREAGLWLSTQPAPCG